MEYLTGTMVGLAIGAAATAIGFDRCRSFYPTVLLVIASYYLLFVAMGGPNAAIWPEILAFLLFAGAAIGGFRRNLWIVAAALIGHGAFDVVHDRLVENRGVPEWWPGFCLGFDLAFGLYLSIRLLLSRPSPCSLELEAASALIREGSMPEAFRRLERAHVLGQSSTLDHVRVHLHMMRWSTRNRNVREFTGQLLRIAGATLGTPLGLVPSGNTGGANVSALRPMPIPPELAALIAGSRTGGAGTALRLALDAGKRFGR
jgi:hypothetical protein